MNVPFSLPGRCGEGPLPGETYPESAGVVNFVHQEIPSRYGAAADHPPRPLDSAEIFGSHIVALGRTTQGLSGYHDKAIGLVCSPLPPGSDLTHAFAAEEAIDNADWRDWMNPDPPIQDRCATHLIPEPQCIGPSELKWKTSVHELGHAVGDRDDDSTTICAQMPSDWGGLCLNQGSGIEGGNSSIMIYGCLEHVDFDGYFSCSDVVSMRQLSPFDSPGR